MTRSGSRLGGGAPRRAVTVIALGLLVASCNEVAEDEAPPVSNSLRFALCSANVASVDVVPGPEGHALFVALEREAAEAFAALTEAHVGETLAVTYGGLALSEGTIRARIASGVISTPATPEAEARALAAALESLPPAPCGAHGASSGS